MKKIVFLFAAIITLILLMNFGCQKFDHTNPLDPEYKGNPNGLPATTDIIADHYWESGQIKISQDSSELIIDKSISGAYQSGDVVIRTVGEGMLKKITDVRIENGMTVAKIKDASLVDVIQEAEISFDSAFATMKIESIESSDVQNILKLAKPYDPENSMTTLNINLVLYDDDKNDKTINDQIRLYGQFSMDQTVRSELVIKLGSVRRYLYECEINQILDLNCEIGLGGNNKELKKKIEKPLPKIKFTPIITMVGPVPIVIQPVLEFVAGIECNIGASLQTGIMQTFKYTTGVEYANKAWTKYSDVDSSFSFKTPELMGKASVKAYLRPEFKIKFYGTVAPKVYAELAAKAEGSVALPSFDLNGEIGIAFTAGVGVDMKIFDYTLFDVEWDIIDLEKVIWEWTNHPDLPHAPALFAPLNNQIINEIRPYFDWEEDDLADTYELELDDQTDFSMPVFSKSFINDSDLSMPRDLNDGIYYWHVRGIDDKGRYGSWSAMWKFTIDTDAPSTLALQSPFNQVNLTDNTPLFNWTEATDAQVYELIVDNSNQFNSPEIHRIDLTQSDYAPSVSLADGTYYWKVRARDSAGNWGDWTDIYSFTLDTKPPGMPVLSNPSNGIV